MAISADEVRKRFETLQPQAQPPAAQPALFAQTQPLDTTGGESEFGKGLRQSFRQAGRNATANIAMLQGQEAGSQTLEAVNAEANADTGAPRVQSFRDIRSGGDLVDWGAGVLGGTVANVAEMGTATAAGAGLGAAAGSRFGAGKLGAKLGGWAGGLIDGQIQAAGENMLAQQADAEAKKADWNDRMLAAQGTGVVQNIADLVVERTMLGSMFKPAAEGLTRAPGFRGVVGRFGKETAKGAGMEAGVEAGQDLAGQAQVQALQSGQLDGNTVTASDFDLGQTVDSAMAGALGGAAMKAPGAFRHSPGAESTDPTLGKQLTDAKDAVQGTAVDLGDTAANSAPVQSAASTLKDLYEKAKGKVVDLAADPTVGSTAGSATEAPAKARETYDDLAERLFPTQQEAADAGEQGAAQVDAPAPETSAPQAAPAELPDDVSTTPTLDKLVEEDDGELRDFLAKPATARAALAGDMRAKLVEELEARMNDATLPEAERAEYEADAALLRTDPAMQKNTRRQTQAALFRMTRDLASGQANVMQNGAQSNQDVNAEGKDGKKYSMQGRPRSAAMLDEQDARRTTAQALTPLLQTPMSARQFGMTVDALRAVAKAGTKDAELRQAMTDLFGDKAQRAANILFATTAPTESRAEYGDETAALDEAPMGSDDIGSDEQSVNVGYLPQGRKLNAGDDGLPVLRNSESMTALRQKLTGRGTVPKQVTAQAPGAGRLAAEPEAPAPRTREISALEALERMRPQNRPAAKAKMLKGLRAREIQQRAEMGSDRAEASVDEEISKYGEDAFLKKHYFLETDDRSPEERGLSDDQWNKLKATGETKNARNVTVSRDGQKLSVNPVEISRLGREALSGQYEAEDKQTIARFFAEGLSTLIDDPSFDGFSDAQRSAVRNADGLQIDDDTVVYVSNGEPVTYGEIKNLNPAADAVGADGPQDRPEGAIRAKARAQQAVLERGQKIKEEGLTLKKLLADGKGSMPYTLYDYVLGEKISTTVQGAYDTRLAEFKHIQQAAKDVKDDLDALTKGFVDTADGKDFAEDVDENGYIYRPADAAPSRIAGEETNYQPDPGARNENFVGKPNKRVEASTLIQDKKPVSEVKRSVAGAKRAELERAVAVLNAIPKDERGVTWRGYADAVKAALDALPPEDPPPTKAKKPDAAEPSAAKKSGQRTDKPLAAAERKEVEATLRKITGEDARVVWEDALGFAASYDMEQDFFTFSTSAPNGTAQHEALHRIFQKLRKLVDPAAQEMMKTLMKVADSPDVRAKLETLLKDHPEALKQLDDAEERVAYMFQFHTLNLLDIRSPAARGWLGKLAEFLNRMVGNIRDNERAAEFMRYFAQGEFAKNPTQSAVAKVVRDNSSRYELGRKVKDAMAPYASGVESVFIAAADRLRDTGVPALKQLSTMFKAEVGDDNELGFLQRAVNTQTRWVNDYAKAVKGLSDADKTKVRMLLSGQTVVEPGAEVRAAATALRSVFADVYRHAEERGVPLKERKNYFPRVWDTDVITSKRDEFVALLQKYGLSKDEALRATANVVTSINDRALAATPEDPGYNPFFGAINERKLPEMDPDDIAPFLQQNLDHIVPTYLQQAAKRIEYEGKFGANGERLTKLLARAEEQGSTEEDLVAARKAVMAMEGTLNTQIDPKLRTFNDWMITYQNVRLLPLSLLSQATDTLGIAMRSGEMRHAWQAFKQGVKDIPKWVRKDPKLSEWEQLAMAMGVLEDSSLDDTSQHYFNTQTSGVPRKINDAFFKYIGLDGWNRSMRSMGTRAAVDFIQTHLTKPTEHSERFMKELRLTKDDVQFDKDGKLITDPANEKLREAIHRFVDQAVIRPSPADRTVWGSDPRFAVLQHLKQYTYSFHRNLLAHAREESDKGNDAPLAILGTYIPVMMAAMYVKGMAQGGGELPEYMEEWGPFEWLWNAIDRSGIFGLYNYHVWDLPGPAVNQATDFVGSLSDGTTGLEIKKAIPGNQLAGVL